MNINNAFPSKWIKSGDIPEDSDLILTITSVSVENVGSGEESEQKPVIYFKETEKGLVLNKTNADTISKLHTPETENWNGKRIALFATEVDYGGKQTLGIRVRLKTPKAAPAAQVEGGSTLNRQDLLDRYQELFHKATTLAIPDLQTITPDEAEASIVAKGKALRQLIAEAEAF